jgi:Holliday junction DNA helicase RuvA
LFGLRFLSALGIMKLKEKRMFSCILKKFGENMISYIKGTLERRGENDIIVEAGGIFVSPATLAKLPQTGEAVQIFTYFSVKEDGMSLYGFAAREEQEMFEKLLLVNGVGPKGALGFLSVLNPSEIVMAILSDDVKTLSKAPGVGRKTAQRVILDLKDKFKTEDAVSSFEGAAGIAESVGGGDAKFEAIDAMTALGYSRSEAAQAVNAVAAEGMTTEDILKAALKRMITF